SGRARRARRPGHAARVPLRAVSAASIVGEVAGARRAPSRSLEAQVRIILDVQLGTRPALARGFTHGVDELASCAERSVVERPQFRFVYSLRASRSARSAHGVLPFAISPS